MTFISAMHGPYGYLTLNVFDAELFNYFDNENEYQLIWK